MTRRLMRRVKKTCREFLRKNRRVKHAFLKRQESQTLAKLLADLSERLIRGKVRLLRVRHGV